MKSDDQHTSLRAVRREDWKIAPMPWHCEAVAVDAVFSLEEFSRIQMGLLPMRMEDKWFVFYEDPWLHLHLSWTGFHAVKARFEKAPGGGARVVEIIVNRELSQVNSSIGDDSARAVVAFIRQTFLRPVRDEGSVWEAERNPERLTSPSTLSSTLLGGPAGRSAFRWRWIF